MWWSYQDVAEAKERVQREIAKRKKKGERFDALLPQTTGKKLCTTFWGQAWCRNLETYQEYESRLPRGRSYFRQGNVYGGADAQNIGSRRGEGHGGRRGLGVI